MPGTPTGDGLISNIYSNSYNNDNVPPFSSDSINFGNNNSVLHDGVIRKLHHNAYIYNSAGKRVGTLILKKKIMIRTFGRKILINGRYFYRISDHYYLAAGNFVGFEKGTTHNAYIYNKKGKRVGKTDIKKTKGFKTYETIMVKGRKFYNIRHGKYIAAGNFIGKDKKLHNNAYVYNGQGKRIGNKVLKKGTKVKTYSIKKIGGRYFCYIRNGEFLLLKNFKKG
ncbi:SLAP domain-containing protein [Lactobacillus sp. ESL0791]|uniref:SLAP domain-containing protein n=1 Tax=Lactobacillus sp. ESL0791 TaxID=2983234 RepID=UPI0023F70B7D|nr:SLAP domain-containing protein [Lactobacillus sp. ESL0791]MDF7639151.1 SLAP domain-containing protein [Lactobacillus sp. ESL0791]